MDKNNSKWRVMSLCENNTTLFRTKRKVVTEEEPGNICGCIRYDKTSGADGISEDTEKEFLDICGCSGYNKASGSVGIPGKSLKLVIKIWPSKMATKYIVHRGSSVFCLVEVTEFDSAYWAIYGYTMERCVVRVIHNKLFPFIELESGQSKVGPL